MENQMTEAEIFNILLLYGDNLATRFEMFVGGSIGMVVAIFITKDSLSVYLRTALIMIFSVFSFIQIITVANFSTRIIQVVESLRTVTAEKLTQLPMTAGLLDNPTVDPGGYFSVTSLLMIFTWLCCVSLMARPKLLEKISKP